MITPHISKSATNLNIEHPTQFLKPSFILNKKMPYGFEDPWLMSFDWCPGATNHRKI